MKPAFVLIVLPIAFAIGTDWRTSPVTSSRDSTQRAEITEWTVPWKGSRPRDPYVAPDGKVWFVGQQGNYLATLDPASGQFRRFEIEPGTHPHNLIVDRGGQVWYAGNRNARIGRLNPVDGKVVTYPMPDPALTDPHTLVFDQKGDIWFTAQQSNFVGRLTTATGKVEALRVATPDSRPYGIVVDSKGKVWFNEFGSDKIGMIDPATMAIREYRLPDPGARGRRIEVTSDDKVWYVDYVRGYLGRLDPATGRVEEWPAPSGRSSLPYAMAVDERDRIWFVETGVRPNQLVGFDPKTTRFFSITPILPSGGMTVRHMYYHRPTRELWFGTDAGTIGRARLRS